MPDVNVECAETRVYHVHVELTVNEAETLMAVLMQICWADNYDIAENLYLALDEAGCDEAEKFEAEKFEADDEDDEDDDS